MGEQSIMSMTWQLPDICRLYVSKSQRFEETYSALNRKTQIVKKVQHTTGHLFYHIKFSHGPHPVSLLKYRGLSVTQHALWQPYWMFCATGDNSGGKD